MKIFSTILFNFCFALALFAQETVAQADTVYSYLHVDQPALFPGCEDKKGLDKQKCAYDKLEKYIQKSLDYPNEAKKNYTQGKCVVAYTVQLDGSISDIQLIRDLHDGCGQEALRIFKELKDSDLKFSPALLNGKEVAVRNKTVVRFNLMRKGVFTPIKDQKPEPKSQRVQLNRYNK